MPPSVIPVRPPSGRLTGATVRGPLLELAGIRMSYDGRRVLDDVDLTVRPGTVLGLLGANGAGKTTLISVATGLLAPDAGRVAVDGLDLSADRLRAARIIGLAPQRLGVYPTLTTRQNLVVFAELAGLRGRAVRTSVDEVLELLDLGSESTRIVGALSGGQQRRVHTGMALVGRPRLLFLDEPTVGADVGSRRRILHAVRELAAQGAAIVYTSHVLSEFEQLGAEMAVLRNGRIEDGGTVPQLLDRYSQSVAELRFAGQVPGLPSWQRVEHGLLRRTVGSAQSSALVEAVIALGPRACELVDIRLRHADLDDVFLALTGEPATDPDSGADHAACEEGERR